MSTLDAMLQASVRFLDSEPVDATTDPRRHTEAYCAGYAAAINRFRSLLREFGVTTP